MRRQRPSKCACVKMHRRVESCDNSLCAFKYAQAFFENKFSETVKNGIGVILYSCMCVRVPLCDFLYVCSLFFYVYDH